MKQIPPLNRPYFQKTIMMKQIDLMFSIVYWYLPEKSHTGWLFCKIWRKKSLKGYQIWPYVLLEVLCFLAVSQFWASSGYQGDKIKPFQSPKTHPDSCSPRQLLMPTVMSNVLILSHQANDIIKGHWTTDKHRTTSLQGTFLIFL